MSKPTRSPLSLSGLSVKAREQPPHPADEALAAAEPVPAVPAARTASPAPDLKEPGPGLTLYLTRSSWRQLKELGMDVRKPMHALLIEAVNLLFEKHGRPQIAEAGERPKVKQRS